MIFGAYAIAQMISAPLIAKIMPHIGYKYAFIIGTLLVTLSDAAFGFLPLIEDRNLFIAGCFTCRVGMGVGTTAINNAMFVITAVTWPDDIAFRLGTIETGVSLGSMIGPVFSGLADLGGYYLPFVVLGMLPILSGTVATITMPGGTSTSKESGDVSILALLKNPGIFMMSVAVVLCPSGIPLMPEPILATHLQPFGLSLSSIGVVFLIQPLAFTILSPIVGKIAGLWKGHELVLIMFGAFGLALSFLFLGPVAYAAPYEHLWPTLVSLGAIGIFWAFAMVPCYERFITYATYAQPGVDVESLTSAVGSLIVMMLSTGDLLGPMLAGCIFDVYGFQWAMTVGGLSCLFTGMMLLAAFITFGNGEIKWRKSGGKDIEKSDGEKEALLATLTAQ